MLVYMCTPQYISPRKLDIAHGRRLAEIADDPLTPQAP